MVRGDTLTSCSHLTVINIYVKTCQGEMDAHGRAHYKDFLLFFFGSLGVKWAVMMGIYTTSKQIKCSNINVNGNQRLSVK